MMTETDGWLIAFGLAALAAAVVLVALAVQDLREDVALLRITAAVPAIERFS